MHYDSVPDLLRLLSDSGCRAAIFDMDGVVTETSALHARAWKHAFDAFLAAYPATDVARPFDEGRDYRDYVDGRTRLEGVRSFLASRGIVLAVGNEGDASLESMQGIAGHKNRVYLADLARHGATVHQDAVELINAIRAASIKVALATSSRNAALVLDMTDLRPLFDLVVDGNDVDAAGLRSKPAADIFLYAARRLEVPFENCAVFEDSAEALAEVAAQAPACAVCVDRGAVSHDIRSRSGLTVVSDLRCTPSPARLLRL